MYYCCYEKCYYYSKITTELINHYIEYHGETYAEAEKLTKQDT